MAARGGKARSRQYGYQEPHVASCSRCSRDFAKANSERSACSLRLQIHGLWDQLDEANRTMLAAGHPSVVFIYDSQRYPASITWQLLSAFPLLKGQLGARDAWTYNAAQLRTQRPQLFLVMPLGAFWPTLLDLLARVYHWKTRDSMDLALVIFNQPYINALEVVRDRLKSKLRVTTEQKQKQHLESQCEPSVHVRR